MYNHEAGITLLLLRILNIAPVVGRWRLLVGHLNLGLVKLEHGCAMVVVIAVSPEEDLFVRVQVRSRGHGEVKRAGVMWWGGGESTSKGGDKEGEDVEGAHDGRGGEHGEEERDGEDQQILLYSS